MSISRRDFLEKSALLAAAGILQSQLKSCGSATASKDFGIQLWSVKDQMTKDPQGTLKALSSYGYKLIESYGGDKGIFWGMKPKEFQSFNKDLGMRVFASHSDPGFSVDPTKWDGFMKLADEAAEAGLEYLINPFVGMLKTKADYYKVAETFNKQGAYCKKNGMKFVYHNHHYSFLDHDGEIPQDIMMKNTDPALVDFELDIYWVKAAGQDNIQWIKKYPNRFTLYHIKDMHKPAIQAKIAETHKPDPFWGVDSSCVLGQGQLDIPAIVAVARANGAKYFSLEQEYFHESDPLTDAKKGADYLKKIL